MLNIERALQTACWKIIMPLCVPVCVYTLCLKTNVEFNKIRAVVFICNTQPFSILHVCLIFHFVHY